MNKTPNYQLNQWEAGDRVQRTDFNADNAKIDAALAGKAEAAELETAAAAAQVALALGQAAFTPENMPWKIGYYSGNGVPTKTVTITTGFPLSAVLIQESDFYQYGVDVFYILTRDMDQFIIYSSNTVNQKAPCTLTWTDTGLVMENHAEYSYNFNQKGRRYHYIAFRK